MEILQHEIDYFLKDEDGNVVEKDLTECDVEYIEESIKQGYNQGELCSAQPDEQDQDREYWGWWNIVKN